MKTRLATLLGGLLCQAASAQCLLANAAPDHLLAQAGTSTWNGAWNDAWLWAANDHGNGLWLAALGLMAGIAWRRQDR
jgi:hypothetical protein